MSIRVRPIRPPLSRLAFSDTRLMRSIGSTLVGRIRDRASRGQGPDGPFRPLTPAYAAQKRRKTGRSRPDLTVTGRLLGSLQANPSRDEVRITATDDPGKVQGVQALRPFLGLSESDEQFILNRVDTFIRRQL